MVVVYVSELQQINMNNVLFGAVWLITLNNLFIIILLVIDFLHIYAKYTIHVYTLHKYIRIYNASVPLGFF